MSTPSSLEQNKFSPSPAPAPRPALPWLLLTPLPLAPLQPLVQRIARHVAAACPELFDRLGRHAEKRFLIDPVNLPFVLLLEPRVAAPALSLHRRNAAPVCDAVISGTFDNLFRMVDASLDGDALFFSRELRVHGDTEAVVALRNALDDLDGSVLDLVPGAFGALAGPARLAVALMRGETKRGPDERH